MGNNNKQVGSGTNAQGQGEAELYYYNKLKHHMTSKVGNFSCIMHEMGYFTEDNQVNIAKYKQAYNELPAATVPQAMKEEFLEAIDMCQEVSECLPEKCFAKYPYGPEYGRSFFFVMCLPSRSCSRESPSSSPPCSAARPSSTGTLARAWTR